jgi:hypothetical protein
MSETADPVLSVLLQAVASAEAGLTMTLFVNGAIVSGILIGEQAYFARLGADLAETFTDDPTGSEATRERFGMLGANLPAGHVSAYVHLRDAAIFTAGGVQPIKTWRGRLDQIDGWCLGRFTVSPGE